MHPVYQIRIYQRHAYFFITISGTALHNKSYFSVTVTRMTYIDRLWIQVTEFLPNLFGAAIALVVGWIIAEIVAAITRQGLILLGTDRLMGTVRTNAVPTSLRANPSTIVAEVVKWLIILGAVGVAADTLNLAGVSTFIGSVLAYVPNIIVATIIIVVGLIAAERVSALVRAGTGMAALSERSRYAVSQIVRYGLIIFAVMAALTQLNIVPRLIEIAFAGLIFTLALAFGLGGRDHASEWIASLKNRSQSM